MTVDVSPGTVTVSTDVVCGWSTVALHPHFFLADGIEVHDPGIALHPDEARGYPVVDSDDPSATADLVRRAAGGG